jgi:hypothetical protein
MRCVHCFTKDLPAWAEACSVQCRDHAYELWTLTASEEGWDRLPENEYEELMEAWYLERAERR